jgi:hypothetical protein
LTHTLIGILIWKDINLASFLNACQKALVVRLFQVSSRIQSCKEIDLLLLKNVAVSLHIVTRHPL